MHKRFVVSAASVACAVAAVTVGLGSAQASSTRARVGTAASSKSVIKLMTIGPVDSPLFSLPSIPVGAQVAINQINAAGGLNGHRLQLLTCNDENNPNTATACAREAIQEKVAAVVGGLSGSDLKVIPYLKQANIPWVGESTADDYTSPNEFLIGNDGTSGYVAIGTAAAQIGCKKVAIVLSAESLPVFATEIKAGVTAAGHSTVVGTYTPAVSGADWSSIVAAARAAGAQCIAAGTSPVETPGLIAAINSGPKLKLVLLSGGLPSTLLKQLGSAATGVYAVSGYLPFTSTQGVVQWLKVKASQLDPKVPLDAFTESGYASVEVVADAATGLKQVTGATLLRALPKVSDFDTKLGPVVTLTKTNPIPGFSRLFNSNYYLGVVRNDKIYAVGSKPLSTTAALKALAGK